MLAGQRQNRRFETQLSWFCHRLDYRGGRSDSKRLPDRYVFTAQLSK